MKKLFRLALMMSAAAVSFTVASCGGGGGGGGGGNNFDGAAPASLDGYVLRIEDTNTIEWNWTSATWTFENGRASLEGMFWTQASGNVPTSSASPVSYVYKRIADDKAQVTIMGVSGHVTGAVVEQFVLDTTLDLTFNDRDNTVEVESVETYTWPNGEVYKPNDGQRMRLQGVIQEHR